MGTNVSQTGIEDQIYEDLKTLTDPSFWRRVFKAIKTSFRRLEGQV